MVSSRKLELWVAARSKQGCKLDKVLTSIDTDTVPSTSSREVGLVRMPFRLSQHQPRHRHQHLPMQQ